MRAGAGVLEALEHFGRAGKIHYVHLRDVVGGVEDFTECWIGEGNSNIPAVLQTLREVGFRGFMIPDHVPHMEGDTPWCHRGRAYTVGYIRGLMASSRVD
jgi:mannonate dehydratase